MAHRIEVALKKKVPDPRGDSVKKRIENELNLSIDSVRTINVFTLNFGLDKDTLNNIGKELFTDKVIEICSVDKAIADDFDFIAEKGFKPGVTDNVGKTAKKNIEFFLDKNLKDNEKVFYSIQYLFKGDLTKQELELISKRVLGNELIENFIVLSKEEFNEKGIGCPMPVVKGDPGIKIEKFDLNKFSDHELMELSKERCLVLNITEFNEIKRHFNQKEIIEARKKIGLGNELTDVELECFAQTWSEHCKHKEFNGIVHYSDLETEKQETINSLFKTYIKGSTDLIKQRLKEKNSDYLIKIFNDNAGIVKYDDDTNFVFKVETHNSPSALDPYGGAITGIVGVNRDPAGTGKVGAKPLFNTDIFCFGNPFYNKDLPPNTLHPMKIFNGVHTGVKDGGNQSGIPTLNGSLYFDDRYLGKPLVYCGTAGLMPSLIHCKDSSVKEIDPGDIAIMIGGRVGKDGIHGATFSSEERHEGSPVSAVQIGDAITQKIMLDFVWEIKEKGWIKSITDNGAGGLSSSFGELARITNGIKIELDKVPLKYHGLQPWEIFVSESQERMSLVVAPENLDNIKEFAEKRDVELSVLGEFTDSGFLELYYNKKPVAYMNMKFLHEGAPKKHVKAEWKPNKNKEPDFPEPDSCLNELKNLLSSLNICSKEYIVRPYDHEVKGRTIIKPLSGIKNDGPSDASVISPKIKSYEGLVVGHGLCPRYSDIDSYHMSACAFDEMVRNIIATGGRIPDLENNQIVMWSVNDNFCCPDSYYDEKKNPDGKLKFAKIVRANKALYDFATAYNIPCTSGKDSMKNDFKYIDGNGKQIKISIPLTLLYSGVCKIKDIRKCITVDVKNPGDLIYILGLTKNELGASEYFHQKGFIGNDVPKVNAETAVKLYKALGKSMENELIESCHDCSEGGLGITLAESAFSGGYGIYIDLNKIPVKYIKRNDYLLFSESQSRFIVTVNPKNKEKFEEMMKGNVFALIGIVEDNEIFSIKKLNNQVEQADLQELKTAWQKTLRFDLPLERVR
ncbi:phosphoribosylformylglycinamidine synthase subunit PurS [Candidatus Woesearchaeota archaeon]|nr:phosphoribosylformylglycinamidine synthase subunit PurS [Candidatus Woesearchaeota archaeon]